MKTIWSLFIVSFVVLVGRFLLPAHQAVSFQGSYQAFSHIWVGFLMALIITTNGTIRRISIELLAALTLLEGLIFFYA